MRRRIQSPKDEAWIDKQIIALTNQGCPTREIIERYHIHVSRVARVRKEAGIVLRGKSSLQSDISCYNGIAIPDLTPLVTINPRHRYA